MFKRIFNAVLRKNSRLKKVLDKSILVIDDGEMERTFISRFMEKRGITVFTAENGETGLKMAEENTPDLILLDIMMPGIKGPETCRRLKINDKTKDIPVIFLTAKDTPENVIDCYSVGAEFFLAKPVDGNTLLKQMEIILTPQEYE